MRSKRGFRRLKKPHSRLIGPFSLLRLVEVLHACGGMDQGLTFVPLGMCRLPIRRSPSKVCSAARYVENTAHGRSFPFGPIAYAFRRQFTGSGGACPRVRTKAQSSSAAGKSDQEAICR